MMCLKIYIFFITKVVPMDPCRKSVTSWQMKTPLKMT